MTTPSQPPLTRRALCGSPDSDGQGRPVAVHYLEGFEFILPLTDLTGRFPLAFPACDFTLEISSGTGFRTYTAGVHNGVPVNLREDNGRIRVICDRHRLPPGHLWCRMTLHIPDPSMPDGTRDTGDRFPLGIELVPERACVSQGAGAVYVPAAQLPVLGMEEITEAEVAGMFEQLEGSPLSALRPATDAEIEAIFGGEPTAAAEASETDDNQTDPQEGGQP